MVDLINTPDGFELGILKKFSPEASFPQTQQIEIAQNYRKYKIVSDKIGSNKYRVPFRMCHRSIRQKIAPKARKFFQDVFGNFGNFENDLWKF